jgi:hypothetical protein
MALSDYIANKPQTGIPFTEKAQAINTLAAVDTQMRDAQQAAQIRGRREELQTKIANLEAQNDELRARRDKIKANSLSDMDEDKVVAMAKAKGIKDSDIDAWLQARAQRSARSVSAGQQKALEEQAEAMREQNKSNDAQAIFDADAEYTRAFEEAKMATDEKAASTDKNVLAKKNKLDTLKHQFFKNYGIKWEEYASVDEQPEGKAPKAADGEEPSAAVDVVLTEEEKSTLTEPELAKFAERDTTNKEKRAIQAKAQQKIRENDEADKARQKKLAAIKADMATLGIKSAGDVSKVLGNFKKSASRNDKVKVGAFNRIMKFAKNDKVYNSYPKLGELLGKK